MDGDDQYVAVQKFPEPHRTDYEPVITGSACGYIKTSLLDEQHLN